MRKTIVLISMIIVSLINMPSYSQINATILEPEITIKMPYSIGSNSYNLDLDNDGTVDFRFTVKLFTTLEFSHREVSSYSSSISGLNLNKINVGPVQVNDSISSSINYYSKEDIYSWIPEFGGKLGSWPHTLSSSDDIAYVGLKLNKNGNIYYGWAKLSSDGKSIKLYSYAVNSNPSQTILAGQEN